MMRFYDEMIARKEGAWSIGRSTGLYWKVILVKKLTGIMRTILYHYEQCHTTALALVFARVGENELII
jgi:hypothetical protein